MTQQNTIIYGRHPVVEALKHGTKLEKVYLQTGTRGPMEKELRHLCRDHNVPLQMVPKERLNRFTRENHQGVVALQAVVEYQDLEAIISFLFETGASPLVVLLDGVTDTRNVGAIARSAEVLGAHALVIPIKGGGAITSDSVKTSAGALLRLSVCKINSIITAIEKVQEMGLQVLASDLSGTKELSQIDLTVPTALVLGSEGDGISEGVRSRADQTFIIPQVGMTDSLNVSVAAGVMLYEVMQQRGKAGMEA